MKCVIIVQARTTSERLPGKVLMTLGGHPMLAQILRRLRLCLEAHEVVVATTTNSTDDSIVTLAEAEGVRWFRGSEHDVLSRYLGAARESNADVIVRITGDCPLIDPSVVDNVIKELRKNSASCDYVSNVIRRTFPVGLDSEALFLDVLERVNRLAQSAESREHVTYYILREHPELFATISVTDTEDNSKLRWTVDTREDLRMVRRLYDDLRLGERRVPYGEVLRYVHEHPEIAAINSSIQQRPL